jgi:DNA-binding response OmpR family regulator
MVSGHKILIVEDDTAISDMYDIKLQGQGYEVRIARDGQKGLELSKSFLPELILLDILLPNMDGDEMLQKLRETEWGASIRVIILTNISKSEAPASLRLLHVDRYIVKAHHTPTQVAEIVREVLDKNK